MSWIRVKYFEGYKPDLRGNGSSQFFETKLIQFSARLGLVILTSPGNAQSVCPWTSPHKHQPHHHGRPHPHVLERIPLSVGEIILSFPVSHRDSGRRNSAGVRHFSHVLAVGYCSDGPINQLKVNTHTVTEWIRTTDDSQTQPVLSGLQTYWGQRSSDSAGYGFRWCKN